MQGGLDQPDLVAFDYLLQLRLGFFQQFEVVGFGVGLEFNFHSDVVFEEFNLVGHEVGIFLYLLEDVLGVEPDHLNGSELDKDFSDFFGVHEGKQD